MNLSEKVILIVDDDEDLRDVIDHVFRLEGFSTITASGGHEALTILENNKVDVIITDMRMPNGSGEELIRAVKKSLLYQSLPIVVMTGFSDIKKDEILTLGAFELLSKPFPIAHIIKTVKLCLKI